MTTIAKLAKSQEPEPQIGAGAEAGQCEEGQCDLRAIATAAARYGLHLRGGFALAKDEIVLDSRQFTARYLLLFGNVGSSLWDVFSRSPEYRAQRANRETEANSNANPLDQWSMRVGNELATRFSARALFPFGGPPHFPFLRWAMRAENLANSKLGMLIHPRYGLWHAYRFALAFANAPADSSADAVDPASDSSARDSQICEGCQAKPCQRACPVNAFSLAASGQAVYDVRACFAYLSAHPDSQCMRQGCRARGACPQGAEHHYTPPHAAFHMRAFVRAMHTQPEQFRASAET